MEERQRLETNGTKPLGGHIEHTGRRKRDPIILPETETKGNVREKQQKDISKNVPRTEE